MIQQDSLRLTDPHVARALKENIGFVDLFLHPCSPTEIAERAGMAPNLAHHHARKLASLGLLFEQRREGGRVYYQLAAREFRVPWSVLPPVDETAGEMKMVQEFFKGFGRAYQLSWLTVGQDEEYVAGFGDHSAPPPPRKPDSSSLQPIPTHFDALTLRLRPERYRKLARDLSRLLEEAMQESMNEQGYVCSVAVLAFEGHSGNVPADWQGRVARQITSFLGRE